MATIEVEAEDIFEGSKVRTVNRVRGVIAEYFSADKADFAEDLMDALDVEKLLKFDIEVVLHMGKQTISVPGFEVESNDEEEDDE